jgi:glycosyltransferase involved in cell wall biosynthesis
MPVMAFGPAAQRYAARFPSYLDAIFADETMLGEALAEAVERARRGQPFFSVPVFDELHSTTAQRLAPLLLESSRESSRRRVFFDALSAGKITVNGKEQKDHGTIDEHGIRAFRDLALLSDSMLVRSWTEYFYLTFHTFSIKPANSARVVVPPRTAVPRFQRNGTANTILVWAPERPAPETAIFAFAYEELHMPVVIVCESPERGNGLGVRARFIGVEDVGDYLDAAGVLVDAAISDPASAIELAKLGIPVVASTHSGAHEYVDGVGLFEPGNYQKILHATLMAFGASPPCLRPGTPGVEDLPDLAKTRPVPPARTPLVSMIIPTLNRRGILPRAVESIVNQTYENVEIVIVNDGGVAVDDLVSHLPRVRIINNEVNLGVAPSINVGLAAVQGEYIGLLGDDDYIFADHLMRAVSTLERTGASVAHSMVVASYLVAGSDGYYELQGHAVLSYQPIDPTELLANNIVGGTSVLYHRRVFERIGNYLDLKAKQGADFELNLRILQHFDFVMIPRVTANVDFRADRSNISGYAANENLEILTYLYSKYPVPQRVDIEEKRRQIYQMFGTSAGDPTTHSVKHPLAVPRRQYRLQGPTAETANTFEAPAPPGPIDLSRSRAR